MRRLTANIWLIVIFMILLGVFLIGMPKYVDDHLYLVKFVDWFFDQGVLNPEWGGNFLEAGVPWKEIFETWNERYALDNARLGNITVVFFLLLPKWVGSGIAWLCSIWIFISGLRLAGVDIRRSALVSVALFLFGFFIPWRQHMGSIDFQFNYILPSALQFWFLVVLTRRPGRAEGKWRRCAGIFIIGVLAGGWHEGLSVPVLSGLLFVILLHRGCRRSVTIWGVAGMVLGILWIMAAPGQWERIESAQTGVVSRVSVGYAIRAILSTGMYWVMVALLAVEMFRLKLRGERNWGVLKDIRIQFLLVSGLISVGIVFFTYAEARVGWWTSLSGVFGILYIIRKYHGDYWRRYSKRNIIPATIFIVLAIGHRLWVDVETIRIRNSYIASVERYVANREKEEFVDIQPRNLFKIFSNLPGNEVFIYGSWSARDYYSRKYEVRYNAIPAALEYVNSKDARVIPGNAGLLEYKGHYFMPYTEERGVKEFKADYGNGEEKLECYGAPFTSRGDGKEYYYVSLCQNWYDCFFRTLRRVDLP
ncbi:MAG: hypothetical protein K2G67_07640 [Muribaculaceae bacterium]|nr:hypothetical protein [Muribaculaceae bacterium]